MIIPTDPERKAEYIRFIIDTCLSSQKERRDMYERRRRFFLFGSNSDQEVVHNRLESHLDLVTSFLYSPDAAQFSLSAALNADDAEVKQFMAAQDVFNAHFRDEGMFDYFGDAIPWALVFDTMILKVGWSDPREAATVTMVEPWKFGVFSEEETDLDSQPAFVHSYHIDYDNAVQRLQRAGLSSMVERLNVVNTPFESPYPELITRMIISSTSGENLGGNVTGSVNPSYIARPSYRAKVDRPLVAFNELTVWDDECHDYRTFWVVDPDIIISDSKETIEVLSRSGEWPRRDRKGKFQSAEQQMLQFYNTKCNLYLPRNHPYVHVRPYQIYDYFWGKSHIESLIPLQEWSNERLEQIHDILDKQAYPPRVGSGFMGLSDERMEAFGGADTWVMDQLPQAQIKELHPEMPPDIFADYSQIGLLLVEASGLTEVLQGKGEPGVRSRGHAKELRSTGAGRIKKTAIRLEAPLVRFGDLVLKLKQRNDDEEIRPDPKEDGKPGDEFLFHNLGERFSLRIAGHSHSPLFVDDSKELAGALFKAQAIDQEWLIRMLNPAHRDNLIHAVRTRQKRAAQMKMLEGAMGGGAKPHGGGKGTGKGQGAGAPM